MTTTLTAYDTIAALKAFDAAALAASGDKALTLAATTAGDVDPFYVSWSPSSSAANDNVQVFRPTTGAASTGNGRWLRVAMPEKAAADFDNLVLPDAVRNLDTVVRDTDFPGATDDARIQAAIDYVNSIGGGRVELTGLSASGRRDRVIMNTIFLKNNVELFGSMQKPSIDGVIPAGEVGVLRAGTDLTYMITTDSLRAPASSILSNALLTGITIDGGANRDITVDKGVFLNAVGCTFLNSHFSNCTGSAFETVEAERSSWVNLFLGCQFTLSDCGLLYRSSDSRIIGCDFSRNRVGAKLATSGAITFTGNRLELSTEAALEVCLASFVTGNCGTITGNALVANARHIRFVNLPEDETYFVRRMYWSVTGNSFHQIGSTDVEAPITGICSIEADDGIWSVAFKANVYSDGTPGLPFFVFPASPSLGNEDWTIDGTFEARKSQSLWLSNPPADTNGLARPVQMAWQSYSPSVTPDTGSFTSASASGKYKRIGSTVFVRASVSIINNGSGNGSLHLTLPVPTACSANDHVGTGRNFGTGNGKALQVDVIDSTHVQIVRYDNAYPVVSGDTLTVEFTYEAA